MNLPVVQPPRKYPVYPEKLKPLKALYDLDASLEKEFSYMDGLVKEETEIIYPTKKGFKVKLLTPCARVVITPSIYRKYSCLDYPGCTRCCEIHFWSVSYEGITPDEVVAQFPEGMAKKVVCMVNGRERSYWCYDHTVQPCIFSQGMCTIHLWNPISCSFPLVYLQYKNGVMRVGKRLYGRNHLIGCPAQFSHYSSCDEFENDTINRFTKLKTVMDMLEVPNIVGEVIEKLREGITSRLQRVL